MEILKLNGSIEKFESMEQIEIEMEKAGKLFQRKINYIELLKKRQIELINESGKALERFEALDNIRGNFEENYKLIK